MANDDERTKLLELSHQLDRLNNPCQLCGKHGAIGSSVHFASNFGMGFRRFERHLSGDFCPRCIHKNFAAFTVTNLLGWLGIISMIKVVQFLVSNASEYERAVHVMGQRRKDRVERVAELLDKSSKSN